MSTREWVEALVEATADRAVGDDRGGVVAFTQGKKTSIGVEVRGGRFVGVTDEDPQVEIPVTNKQLESWAAGELRFGVAFMKGDLKPVGSTGPLLAAFEILDDPDVRSRVTS